MQIIAAAGLATNFSAVRALITTGIQDGHMRMHMGNILRQLKATDGEAVNVRAHFEKRSISYAEVASYLDALRKQNPQE